MRIPTKITTIRKNQTNSRDGKYNNWTKKIYQRGSTADLKKQKKESLNLKTSNLKSLNQRSKKKKRMKKNDDSLRNLEDTIRIPIYALWEFQKAKSKESLFEK